MNLKSIYLIFLIMYTLRINHKAYIHFQEENNIIKIISNPKLASKYNNIGEAMRIASIINNILETPIVTVVSYYEG